MESFFKQLVKYAVFRDGAFQYDAMENMLAALKHSRHYIDKKTIDDGNYRSYNSTAYDVPDNTPKAVRVNEDKIYLNDVLVGSYQRNATMQRYGSYKNEHSYFITSTQGISVGQLRVSLLRSSFYLQTLPEKKYFEIYSAERQEEKIIAEAARVLVAAGALKQP